MATNSILFTRITSANAELTAVELDVIYTTCRSIILEKFKEVDNKSFLAFASEPDLRKKYTENLEIFKAHANLYLDGLFSNIEKAGLSIINRNTGAFEGFTFHTEMSQIHQDINTIRTRWTNMLNDVTVMMNEKSMLQKFSDFTVTVRLLKNSVARHVWRLPYIGTNLTDYILQLSTYADARFDNMSVPSKLTLLVIAYAMQKTGKPNKVYGKLMIDLQQVGTINEIGVGAAYAILTAKPVAPPAMIVDEVNGQVYKKIQKEKKEEKPKVEEKVNANILSAKIISEMIRKAQKPVRDRDADIFEVGKKKNFRKMKVANLPKEEGKKYALAKGTSKQVYNLSYGGFDTTTIITQGLEWGKLPTLGDLPEPIWPRLIPALEKASVEIALVNNKIEIGFVSYTADLSQEDIGYLAELMIPKISRDVKKTSYKITKLVEDRLEAFGKKVAKEVPAQQLKPLVIVQQNQPQLVQPQGSIPITAMMQKFLDRRNFANPIEEEREEDEQFGMGANYTQMDHQSEMRDEEKKARVLMADDINRMSQEVRDWSRTKTKKERTEISKELASVLKEHGKFMEDFNNGKYTKKNGVYVQVVELAQDLPSIEVATEEKGVIISTSSWKEFLDLKIRLLRLIDEKELLNSASQ